MTVPRLILWLWLRLFLTEQHREQNHLAKPF